LGKKKSKCTHRVSQIGPRDVAKFFGGMGACGFHTRCCSKFLCQFESISIRMAKTQGISLTPSDITGRCDRLRCCLAYEHCQYVEALKNMPKRNKMVMTPNGIGKIRDVAPLRECVYVQQEEFG
jgi:cell fate regulator YaaT (PSP1 superfamily)